MAARQRREVEETAEDVLEGLDEYDLSKRPEVRIINRYVRIRTWVMLVFKAVGSLALLWLTVVLLGGFVTSLEQVDFLFLTFIGFLQVAGFFNALADDQFIFVVSLLLSPLAMLVSSIEEIKKYVLSRLRGTSEEDEEPMSWAFRAFYRISLLIMQVVIWILYLPVISILFGPPILCFMLSAYRLDKDNDFKDDGDASKANLKPALNIFYSLAVAQSILHIVWINIVEGIKGSLTLYVCNKYGYERRAMDDYITETKRKCIHDMALADDWNLITYALSLLDSESIDSDEYCSGLRILDTLIEEKVPVNRLMVQSLRQRIQKLIRTLGWRRPTDRETRELAARILAHLASDLSLADFPGALESISSLLETQCYKKDQEYLHFPLSKNRSRRRRKKSVLEDMIDKQGPANVTP